MAEPERWGDDMKHPRERPRGASGLDRRAFLKRGLTASVALGGSALLAACDRSERASAARSPLPAARPDRPVTLPIFDDNPAIEDGLSPERNTVLKVYNWEEYIWPRVVREFEEEYGVEVEISNFANMDEALPVLRSGANDFDVFFHRVDVLRSLVTEKLLRPLNHSYLENLERHVWPVYQNPFYDQGARYTVPYTVYTTGIGWRTDRVDEDVAALRNPYDIFWNKKYKGKVQLMNDYREVISMALLRTGHTDLNTGDRERLAEARDQLVEAAEVVSGLSIDAYTDLPHGRSWVHQAWSGDMVAAQYYFPKGQDPSVARFWAPEDGAGAVGNDTIAILRSGRNPVLAHHFLNYLLDGEVAMKNYSWNGYQPPQQEVDPDELVAQGYVPSYVRNVIVRPVNFNRGFMELELDPSVDRLWHAVWREFTAHV
jgi:spermidine/putrescine transport system substrate-binding protein